MTIIAAVESGRPFRRSSWEIGLWAAPGEVLYCEPDDILATDWVTGDPSVRITRADLVAAVTRAIGATLVDPSLIARELGLE